MSTETVIRIMCPNLQCRAILGVPASARGKRVRCKNCGAHVMIPQKPEPKPAPDEDAQAA